MSDRSFGQEVVDTYRAWDEFSRRSNGDAAYVPEEDPNRVIDIDIAPQVDSPLHFEDSAQVQAVLEDLLERCRAAKRPQNGDFIASKLEASLMHLGILAGNRVQLSDRLRVAMGVTPELVDESVLDDEQEALDGQLKAHGLRFDADHREAFDEQLGLHESKAETSERLLAASRWSGKFIKRYTGEESLVTEPELAEVDAVWVGWFGTGDGGHPFFKMNVHPKNKYTPARIAAVAIHEMGHGTQFGIWKRAILQGDMSPALGVTTLHTPENTQAEAYAQLVEQLGLRSMRGEDSWLYQWQAYYHDYLGRAQHNAHLMINKGYDESKVVDYSVRRMPFITPEVHRQNIREARSNPELVSYLACYEPGMAAVRPVLDMPTKQQKTLLTQLGSQPLSLEQIRDMVSAAA